jgi:hypothetical protein
VVLKNAKAHAFYENSEIQYNDHASINFVPLQLMTDVERANFENTLPENRFWPEVGSRSMIRLLEGQDVVDGWVIVQSGVYRYAVILDNQHVEVRSVLFSYLATQVIWNSSEE